MSGVAPGLDIASIERRLEDLHDPSRSPGGSAYTDLYFSRDARPEGAPPTLVFQHIRKTAGTSVRQVLRKSLKRHASVHVPSLRHGANAEGTARTRESLAAWHRDLHARLAREEWARLVAVASHEANYFLPLIETPTLAFTLVRDPVDRVVSRYYFANRPPKPGTARKREQGIGPGIGEELREWPLDQIYARVGGADPAGLDRSYAFGAFFNGQARSLLEPHYDTAELSFSDGPPPDAELWRERLRAIVERHYLLGVSERFDEGLAAAAARFGWKQPASARKKVNTSRPATTDLPPELRELIARYNWLDLELHARAAELAEERSSAPRIPGPAKRNKTHRTAIKRGGERVAIEVYLASGPLPAEQPTVVFQHIAKTGGTSLREVIHRNYAPVARHLVVTAPGTGDAGDERTRAAKDWYEGLGESERASILCIAGHPANHLLYLLERPRQAITIVREPVDRVLSRFHFGGQKRGKRGIPHTLDELFEDPRRLAEAEPSLSREYVNGQSRALLEPLFDVDVHSLTSSEGPPEDADLWCERLFNALEADYMVGTQDRFDNLLARLTGRLGWVETHPPRAKVNRARAQSPTEDEALLSRARSYNWLDSELYRTASGITAGLVASTR